jgi:hypothetical protein
MRSSSGIELFALLSVGRSQRPLERDHRAGVTLAGLFGQHFEHFVAAGDLRCGVLSQDSLSFFAACHPAVT